MYSYILEGFSWAKDIVSWSYSGDPRYHNEIRQAFSTWDNLIALDFVEVSPTVQSDIFLGFSPIDGPSGTLGNANTLFFQSSGEIISSVITFDPAESWILSNSGDAPANGTRFYPVAVHEIGHTIGLGHPEDPNVIMYAYANDVPNPTYWDIYGAQQIYGADDTGVDVGQIDQFDPLSYIASHGDLIVSFGINEAAGSEHFWQTGLFEAGRQITFEGLEYIASYSDLMSAFGTDGRTATNHFIQDGYFEGRAVTFEALEYIASHGDLAAAFGADIKAGAAHFISTGTFEGRDTTFNGLEYIASYSDLIAAFGADTKAGASHFIFTGTLEGRDTTFNGLEYIASYADLIQAFEADPDTGAAHYLNRGLQEGRQADGFDAQQYLANYSDLQVAYGTDLDAATAHYITDGFAEGRVDEFLF